MMRKIIISVSLAILCFNLLAGLILNNHSITMAQNQVPCNSCPRLANECKTEWNVVKRGICQSDQEWYLYDINEPNTEVWIEVRPQLGLDVDLYATWSKSCPQISSYDCISNTGGSGQKEMCHFIVSMKQTPQFFMVKKVNGSGCYDIFLSSSQSAPITIQSYTTIDNTKSKDNTGKSSLIFIFFGIIILIAFVIFLLRKKPIKK